MAAVACAIEVDDVMEIADDRDLMVDEAHPIPDVTAGAEITAGRAYLDGSYSEWLCENAQCTGFRSERSASRAHASPDRHGVARCETFFTTVYS